MKKAWALVALLFLAALPLSGQSNQLLDEILEAPAVSYGQAAYLVLTAVQKLPEEATPSEAAQALEEQGWKVRVRQAEEPLSLGEYAYLLMRAFELKGGLFYRIFPGPRYACREVAWRGWITGKAYPGRSCSGEEAVRMLGTVMEHKGGRS